MITINLANKSSYDFFSNTESRFYILTDPESLRGEGVGGGGGALVRKCEWHLAQL